MRFVHTAPEANLIAVEPRNLSDSEYQALLADLAEPRDTTTSAPEEPTETADLIGRQFVMDYIDLASNGEAGAASIEALAEKYVESIPTLNTAPRLAYTDLKIVTNTNVNFQNYAQETAKIYEIYKAKLEETGIQDGKLDSLSPVLYSSATTISETYTEAASQLAATAVPGSMAQAHLGLINSFLSTAEAMKALSGAGRDSAKAFAGIITLNENIDKEQGFIQEIDAALASHGI